MKRSVAQILAALVLFAAACSVHAQVARVEGVLMPAWVERGGVREPIIPGMLLQPGDVLHTGPGSRLTVRMAERSLVKLGENGQLRLTAISATQEAFQAVLNVLQGAFRFTTDLAVKSRRRDVRISVGAATAGIRGTDLWGRSRDNTEVICLIEGAIEVGAQGEAPVLLDQPLQFYRRIGGQAQPVGVVDKAQIEQWAQETETPAGRGAARVGGRFDAVLARADNQAAALALYDRLRNEGYPAQIAPVRESDRTVYVVRIRNLASAADARALEAKIRGQSPN